MTATVGQVQVSREADRVYIYSGERGGPYLAKLCYDGWLAVTGKELASYEHYLGFIRLTKVRHNQSYPVPDHHIFLLRNPSDHQEVILSGHGIAVPYGYLHDYCGVELPNNTFDVLFSVEVELEMQT